MRERLEENLRNVLSYLASETMKARKSERVDRVQRLSIAFKILLKEYNEIRRSKERDQ